MAIKLIKSALVPATLALFVATAFSFLARLGWPFEIAAHFRAHYVLAALALLVPYFLWRIAPRQALAAALLLAVNAVPVGQHFMKAASFRSSAVAADEPTMVVVTANLYGNPAALRRAIKFARAKDADLVALTEIPLRRMLALDRLSPDYPYVALSGNRNNWDVALLSKFPFTDQKVVRVGVVDTPILCVEMTVKGKPLTVVAVHPPKPLQPDTLASRNKALGMAFDSLKSVNYGLVVGDMNSTVWSPVLWDKSSQYNGTFDVTPTWLTRIPFAGLSLDHLYTTGPLKIRHRAVGPFIGSDHYPVVFHLQFSKPARQTSLDAPEPARAGFKG